MCPKSYVWFACAVFVAGGGTVSAQADKKLEAFIASCDKRVADHPYFSKVTMLKWTKNPPFVFYIERPPKDDKTYQRMIVNSYMPFLDRLLKIFEREYATRLQLKRRGAAPGFAIAVLNSRGSYGNYAQAVQANSLHYSRSEPVPASAFRWTSIARTRRSFSVSREYSAARSTCKTAAGGWRRTSFASPPTSPRHWRSSPGT